MRISYSADEAVGRRGICGRLIELRRIVRELFPEAWDAVMNAPEPAGGDRETGRVWAFCHHVEAHHFPVYELEEYEQIAYDVPIVRFGWSVERIHDLGMPVGELLLLSLCGDPYILDSGLRVTILEAAERHVRRELLAAIPGDGLSPADLRARPQRRPYAAAADFADWVLRDIRSDLAALPTTDGWNDAQGCSA